MGTSRRRNSTRPSNAVAAQLADVANRLTLAYSTCATVQLALEGQNADQDRDIARCIRQGISEPLATQIEQLRALAAALGSRAEALP